MGPSLMAVVLRSAIREMRFLISAGEASGEVYGAQLISALAQRVSAPEFFGLGGDAMRAAGCETVVDAAEISVVGLFEVVSHLPRIYGRFRHLLRRVDERRPDAAILIDFPEFNFRLARQLHARGVPVFYYISPQLWAWRPGRIELVRRYVREMLVIFPFEESWYRERGVNATFVGHPLADVPAPTVSRAEYADRYGLDPEKIWVALLPGSRRKEVRMNLPEMIAAGRTLGPNYQLLLPVASTLDPEWVLSLVQGVGVPLTLTRDARPTLTHSRAGLVASGTATVEAALMGLPFVIVYRVSPLTWLLGRWLVRVPFFGMVNLIAGREIVPELVQSKFTGTRAAGQLKQLLADGAPRRQMLLELEKVGGSLRDGRQRCTAAGRAAEVILASLSATSGQDRG